MRVAVALPALPPSSPQRISVMATLAELARLDVELEGFAEEPRQYASAGFAVHHYLRASERELAGAFDTALYPLGRDWRPYEASWLCMAQRSGLVWVLDPVLHHLLVGGVAVRGWWDSYRETTEEVFGRDAGRDLAMTVAWGWAVRSTYRRHDPVPALLRRQAGVCAATRSIAADLERLGTPAPVVPLATPVVAAQDGRPRRCRRILLLSFHYGWPEPVLQALRALLAAHGELDLRVVVPEVIQDASVGPRAGELNILDRVEWLTPDDAVLEREVQRADLIVHLRDDPTAGERTLMATGLSRGCPAMVLRAPHAHDLPPGCVVEVEPGRVLQASFSGMVSALVDDNELYRGLVGAATELSARLADCGAAAVELRRQLEAAAAQRTVWSEPSASTWQKGRREMLEAVSPAGATRPLIDQLAAELDAAMPAPLRDRARPD